MYWLPTGPHAGLIVVPLVVLAEEADAKFARINCFLDIRHEGIGRVKPAMQPVPSRGDLQLSLIKELMRYNRNKEAADAKFIETIADELPCLNEKLQCIPDHNAILTALQLANCSQSFGRVSAVDLYARGIRENRALITLEIRYQIDDHAV